jgi:peptide deformylase
MIKQDFEILLLGHPTLRKIAKPIDNITQPYQNLFENLLDFVIERKGAGIAAPQVNISERFFIMSSNPNERYPNAPKMKPIVIVNPEIISHSDELIEDWEGCLSIPSIRALVPRYSSVTVKFTSRLGDIVEADYSGFIARVFQHEIDHLNGIVFLDRVKNTQGIMMEQEWLKRVRPS